MSNVTMCDVCGEVYEHDKCTRLELLKKNSIGGTGGLLTSKDLCPYCTVKVQSFLNGQNLISYDEFNVVSERLINDLVELGEDHSIAKSIVVDVYTSLIDKLKEKLFD